MKFTDMAVGQTVKVTRGYSVRPAVIDEIRPDGRVGVHFTDTDSATAKALGPHNRSDYFGATVRPGQVQPDDVADNGGEVQA